MKILVASAILLFLFFNNSYSQNDDQEQILSQRELSNQALWGVDRELNNTLMTDEV